MSKKLSRSSSPAVVALYPGAGDLRPAIRRILDQGFEFRNEGRARRALTCFSRVLKAEPRFAVAMFMIGVVEYERGNFKAAISALDACVRIRPRHEKASLTLFFCLAHEDRNEEAFAEALRFLRGKESGEYRMLLAELASNLRQMSARDPALAKKCRAMLKECAKIPVRKRRAPERKQTKVSRVR